MTADNHDPRTLLVHVPDEVDPITGGVVPPIHPASTFQRDPDLTYARFGNVYARDDSPTNQPAEDLLARLEAGEAAMLFGSGMAAATSLILGLRPGDHVVAPMEMYWSLKAWLRTDATEWGLSVSFVDMSKLSDVEAAIDPGRTKLVWIETPANPTWSVTDIAGVVDRAKLAGAAVAADNTVSTPILTRPLTLGADFVMHSATKYLNGHSDVLAGALVAKSADHPLWAQAIRNRQRLGAVLGPFEGWLLLRGMRTLALRVEASCRTAQILAERLADHPAVVAVRYPGLPEHPGHAVAKSQMAGGFGGMLSIRIDGGKDTAVAVAAALKLFVRATSLGGVESLVEHRASVEGAGTPAPDDLLRLSIGIESVDDLWADLCQALDRR